MYILAIHFQEMMIINNIYIFEHLNFKDKSDVILNQIIDEDVVYKGIDLS